MCTSHLRNFILSNHGLPCFGFVSVFAKSITQITKMTSILLTSDWMKKSMANLLRFLISNFWPFSDFLLIHSWLNRLVARLVTMKTNCFQSNLLVWCLTRWKKNLSGYAQVTLPLKTVFKVSFTIKFVKKTSFYSKTWRKEPLNSFRIMFRATAPMTSPTFWIRQTRPFSISFDIIMSIKISMCIKMHVPIAN